MSLTISWGGKKIKIAVSPGMTLNEVHKVSCEKFQLSNFHQYILLHGKISVDLALPFRLANISNNAVLELERSSTASSQQQDIRVLIQHPDGNRHQETFSDATFLHEILGKLQVPTTPNMALVFLHREILPSSFEQLTLRDLGITSGSAMFRLKLIETFSSSSPVEDTLVPTISAPSVPISSIASPHFIPIQTSAPPSTTASAPSSTTTSAPPSATASTPPSTTASASVKVVSFDLSPSSSPLKTLSMNNVNSSMDNEVFSLSFSQALEKLRCSCFDVVAIDTILSLMKIVVNLLSDPGNFKVRKIRMENQRFQRSIGNIPGGMEFIYRLGFREIESGYLNLLSKDENEDELNTAFQELEHHANDLQIDESKRPVITKPIKAAIDFNPYQTHIIRNQNQPRGPSIIETKVEELKEEKEKIIGFKIPEREISFIFPCDMETNSINTMDSLKEKYDETENGMDKTLILKSMQQRKKEYEKQQNFSTSAMRELDQLKRQKVFTEAILRIHFPDRVILQAKFHPNERISSIHALIQNHLSSSFSSQSFYLFVSPPRIKLNPSSTLLECNLVPAARVNFSWEIEQKLGLGEYLTSQHLLSYTETKTTPMEIEYPKSKSLVKPDETIQKEKVCDTETKSKSSSTGKPKWLKLR